MEVYYNGRWGTVCDNGWDFNDAQVVCNELGLGQAIAALPCAFYGQGSSEICLDDLNCVGTEMTIGNCSHRGWEHRGWGIGGWKFECCHSNDAGVQCSESNGNLFAY